MTHIEPVNFEPAKPQKSVAVKSRSLFLKLTLFFVLPLLFLTSWFLLTSKSIRISTEPNNAAVTIHTPLKLTLAERYLLRKDNYNIEIRADGYQPLNETLQVGEKQNQEFTYTLTPLPGHLHLDVAGVDQAKVSIDDVEQGIAPITLDNIEAGTHSINIKAERYFPYTQAIEIEGKNKTQNLNIELIPAWADVEFVSDPVAAEIIVDDQTMANTPAIIELLEGKHSIRIKKSGFKDWEKTIHIVASEDTAYTEIKLKPADATLFVESIPAGANVTVDGNYVGKTPLETAISPGESASVRLYKQGFVAKTRRVKVGAGQSKKLNITMSSELVDVAFNLKPKDATVYINNKRVQLSGTTLSLPTTQQNITVRKDGYVDYSTTITPIAGIPQNVNVTLKSLRQQKLENIKPIITSKAGQKLKLFYPYAFTMGASRREPGRRSNETEQNIDLKRPFYLGINEVTNDEFHLFKSAHNSGSIQGHSLSNGKQPVANISWDDAALYCNWLSQQESLKPFYKITNNKVSGIDSTAEGYRLPTEAEWAWAARTISKSESIKFPWGNTTEDKMPPARKSGNYADNNAAGFLGKILANYHDSFAVAAPVGSFAPNQKGLYDMGGNIAEWVHDYYAIQASSSKTHTDPLGPTRGEFHVIRGASWAHATITELRLSFRDYTDKPREDVGFRVARYLE
jgi:formylglycine-generating enzyme required for sulfatase activity